MNYKETTQVPNNLFDKYILILKASEIIVLLIIIRQTYGWYDPKTKKRKQRDWISYSQFRTKTNLSTKTISNAISTLVSLGIIKATDKYHNTLATSDNRKGKVCIYYQCLLQPMQKKTITYVKKNRDPMYNLHITKLNNTKIKRQENKRNLKNKTIKKLSDIERIKEILEKKKYP